MARRFAILVAASALLTAEAAQAAILAASTEPVAVGLSADDGAPVVGFLAPPELATVLCRSGRKLQIRAYAEHLNGFVEERALRFVAEPGASAAAAAVASAGPFVSPALVNGSSRYLGSARCATCHRHQHRIHDADPHRTALPGLAGAEAVAAGAALGVATPERDPRCVMCHLTAYGAPAEALAASFDPNRESVGCEACHGPGSAWEDPAIHAVDRAKAIALGMTDLSTLDRQDALCRTCHNSRSPTYKPFDLQSFGESIRHWPRHPASEWLEFARRSTAGGAMPRAAFVYLAAAPPGIPDCAAPETAVATAPQRPTPPPSRAPGPRATPVARPATPPARPRATTPGGEPELVTLAQRWSKREPNPDPNDPVRFTHFAHAHTYQRLGSPISCQDAACHHPLPLSSSKPAESYSCHACHTRPEPAPPGAPRSAKAANHASCMGCHREVRQGPTRCRGCHGRG